MIGVYGITTLCFKPFVLSFGFYLKLKQMKLNFALVLFCYFISIEKYN